MCQADSMFHDLLGRASSGPVQAAVASGECKMETDEVQAMTNGAGAASAAELSGMQLPNRVTQPGLNLAAPRYRSKIARIHFACVSSPLQHMTTHDSAL